MATALARRSLKQDPTASDDHQVDADLLERFLRGEKSEAEEAFRALVIRHGPMVLGVCRRVLEMHPDAEDVFQATFLVLARKAATIRNRKVLAGWLYEVAHRMAVKARGHSFRRRNLERQVAAMSPRVIERNEAELAACGNELRPILHAEVERLPECYRIPVILSYLEGKTNEEVADLLQWPVGTVKGRLSRARDLLRERLSRRGLALSAAFIVTSLCQEKTASAGALSNELVAQTVHLAGRFGPRAFSRDASSGAAHVAGEAAFSPLLAWLVSSIGIHRGLIGRGLCMLMCVALGTSIFTAIAAYVLTPARYQTIRAAVSSWVPFQSTTTPCHRDRDRE
jgi:RNA polymerase sigma factor (sigma-70 family)